MQVNEIVYLGIREAADRIRAGHLSPVELVEAVLERAATLNPQLNAYLTITADLVREQARAAERARHQGVDQGPLAGIPVGLKDLFDLSGAPTTAGSPLSTRAPAADSAVAERLRAAGAAFVGKQHLHEWAFGVTTNNPHFGPCRNPWDPARIPGGSSGGSGAALAAGLCLGAIGSDTGGSIRIPAALCGVVGLKPTAGRVSLRGAVPLAWSLDHAGPLARTVEDVAILLRAIEGYDPADPASVDFAARSAEDPAPGLAAGVAGVRVLVDEDCLGDADPAVAEAVRLALLALEREGARLEAIRLPGAESLSAANATIIGAEAAALHAGDLRERPERIGPDVLARLRAGEASTGVECARARRLGAEWRRRFEALLAGPTVLALPTTPIAAPEIAGTEAVAAARRLTSYTGRFNLTGLPALSVPCGFTPAGLPVGLQLAARPWADALALRVGAAYQRATDWHRRRPSLA